jgi:hypothetical protein
MACGAGDGDRDSSASGTFDDESKALAEAKAEALKVLGPNGDRVRALWDRKTIASSWSRLTLNEIHARRKAFEAARDIEDFCPGYNRSTVFQKDSCWLRIVSAMARYESGFRPHATYMEKSGQTSVGLLMMNPDHCKGAGTVSLLQKAPANIKCALGRMSFLVARDRYLSGPPGANKGAAAYWSVMRSPYRFENLFLGRRFQIIEFTRSYRAVKAPILKTDSQSALAAQMFP